MAIAAPPEAPVRRRELADFLRSRRERLSPDDAGLIPGGRRRTPGLRREEVAQLAAVGVTWYTWLEQGRPINASADVLDAIARALRLDASEREHLFRLAEVVPAVADPVGNCVDPEVQLVLDKLDPLPASVQNSRYDILAWNRSYHLLFPGLTEVPSAERNLLWQVFAGPLQCPLIDRDAEAARMVAVLRGAFARHLGERRWTDFVRDLSAASPEFAQLWSRHDVAEPANRMKRMRAVDGEALELSVTIFALTGAPETRMVVYTPIDDANARRLERQMAASPTA